MPCYESREAYIDYDTENQLKSKEAMLCGILKAMADNMKVGEFVDFLEHKVDWKEVGVTYADFSKWWLDHQKEDQKRLIRERNRRLREEKREAALSKLTKEDRRILGLP
jgi:hypothetical protein